MQAPATPPREPQSAAAVLMVRPARFGFNAETAGSNVFQSPVPAGSLAAASQPDVAAAARAEFDGLAGQLAAAGVDVRIAADTADPPKPDAVFPNNWVSFHRDGTVVLYPMLAPNRRLERRQALIEGLTGEGGFRALRTVDLTPWEAQGRYLEGTGSLVLDRPHRVAYAGLSPRTDLDVLGDFAQQLDYDLVTFEAGDPPGVPVYHTNVLMAVGSAFAVVCLAAIAEPRQREAVADRLRATGRELIEISRHQMRHFAGNLLELRGAAGAVIALSTTAWASLDAAQRQRLERHGRLVAADIPVIEALGGGGVRCMLAEIHLPLRAPPPVP